MPKVSETVSENLIGACMMAGFLCVGALMAFASAGLLP